MIWALEVSNPFVSDSLLLELFHPERTGILVDSIDGLGSPTYNIPTKAYATGDGSSVGRIKAELRNININLAPLFNPDVETSRLKIYRYFQLKKEITLTFHMGNNSSKDLSETKASKIVSCVGYVETMDPDIFSDREGVSITIVCPNPYFYEKQLSSKFFFGRVPLFEFPFENPVRQKTLIMSELLYDYRSTIEYKGIMDTPVVIEINIGSSVGDIALYNIDTLEQMKIETKRVGTLTGGELANGDTIYIDTSLDNRGIELVRGGASYNILGAVNRDADWFTLRPGNNIFSYTTAEKYGTITVEFKWRNTYGAI